jgi:hypothetical protein
VSLRARICEEIYARPGITQLERAQSIYGSAAYQNLVANVCRQLGREGLVSRSGIGGRRDPFTFVWIRKRHTNGVDRTAYEQQLSGQ